MPATFAGGEASREELRYFLKKKVAGEAGFADLVALAQIHLPTEAKLEPARNDWDEMGRGQEKGMHGPMLEQLASRAKILVLGEPVMWESIALGKPPAGMALNRDDAFHVVDALGVLEHMAPGRAVQANEGLRRGAFSPRACIYFPLHSTLDVKHSQAWNEHVLCPFSQERPELAQPVAEGLLMRLHAGARCLLCYLE